MRIPLFAALLAFVLPMGCVDDAIRWEIPLDMTPEYRDAFGEALERNNAHAIRQQYMADPGDGNRRVFLKLPEHMVNQIDVTGDGVSDARGECSGGVMNLVRGMNRDSVVMVVEHESQHALGMQHHDGAGVMAEHAGQKDWSEGDLAECRRVNACR